MANFETHLKAGVLVSAVTSIGLGYFPHIATPKEIFSFFIAGMIGSVLPDIDHNNSTPTKILEFLFVNLSAFLITIYFINQKIPLLYILSIAIASYLGMIFIFYLFKKFTKHRGILHSIPMAFIFWFLTSLISYKYYNLSVMNSYLLGFFVFLGYMTHLILDEIYSVDISNKKLKSSAGTALKFFSKNGFVNLLTYSVLIGLFIFLPQKEMFFHFIKGLINV